MLDCLQFESIEKPLNFYSKRRLRILRDYAIGWTVAFIFLSIVRGVGTEETGSLQFGFTQSLIIAFTLGPIMGIISGGSLILMEEKIYKRTSIRRFLVLRLLYTVFFIVLLILAAYGVYQLYFGTDIDIITFAFDDGSGAIYFYVLSVDFFLNIVRQLNLMLGQGNLGKLLMGKFYHPREEQRIFMFLDLQSSTQLAEQLGHLKYSSLIQDCFNDLGVVVEDGAEIYQYVGDEAVLTWKLQEGLTNESFVNAFFRFKEQIKARETYYQDTYGVVPFFKAGIHAGTVTVTEIGKFKKEIAYHGDPINTAARIQGKCNELGAELLISQTLEKHVHNPALSINSVGSLLLRGKQREIGIYSVSND